MKKLILLIITTLLSSSCKNDLKEPTNNRFVITGNIKGITDNSKVYLKTKESGVLIVVDSTTTDNESFTFKGTIDKPTVYGIFIKDVKGAIGIFMENDTIIIKASKDSLSSFKILNSSINNEYSDFLQKSNQIISKMNTLFPAFQKARAENDVEKLKIINKKMQVINDENTSFALSYAKQHPNSYISAMALHSVLRIPTINKDTIRAIYTHFSDYVKKGNFAIETAHFLEASKKQDTIQK